MSPYLKRYQIEQELNLLWLTKALADLEADDRFASPLIQPEWALDEIGEAHLDSALRDEWAPDMAHIADWVAAADERLTEEQRVSLLWQLSMIWVDWRTKDLQQRDKDSTLG